MSLTPAKLSLATGLLWMGCLLFWAWQATGGVFEYPIDDTYIHLAVAEQIWAGGYGVNAGEYTSAASSPLYPFLLLPVFGPEVQRLMPQAWNIAALVLACVAWGRLMLATGAPEAWVKIWALTGPIFLNMSGLAMLGMEHTLHMALGLVTLLGLVEVARGAPVRWWLIAALVLAPLIRLEGIALSLAGATVLLLIGHLRMGLMSVAGIVLPLLAFFGYLTTLGLDPLPNSVQAKLNTDNGVKGEGIKDILGVLNFTFRQVAGQFLAVMVVLAAVGVALNRALRQTRWAIVAVIAAVSAHLIVGRIGWMHRYESYAVTLIAAATLIGLGGLRAPWGRIVIIAPALYLAGFYVISAAYFFPKQSLALHQQQGEMARFAQEIAQTNVAVNDLGRVVWGNPNYVLDLWGLASAEALDIRMQGAAPGWAGPLAEARGVQLAMIYDVWLSEAVGPGWVKLGVLMDGTSAPFLGNREVSFYATSAEYAPQLREQLAVFAKDVPAPARFIPTQGQP